MINKEITDRLFELQDVGYRDFQSKLVPSTDAEIIGVRCPELRSLAKEIYKSGEYKDFLRALPHRYYDEYQLHAFIISVIKNYDECIDELERFLPCVDNWATCDTLLPKVFVKHKTELSKKIDEWLKSDLTYTVRFGVSMLMRHFLNDDFRVEYAEKVAALRSDEYYINMMTAWYFATALAKQYESIIPFIENHSLDKWTHNKAIQKSIESRRISPEQKEYLRSLKVKKE
ncbi:MAG: DNA alkylation repair protein [Ruminococcus sp.]|nr:DNA alkylation repair protein [Ruminococcus sp.]